MFQTSADPTNQLWIKTRKIKQFKIILFVLHKHTTHMQGGRESFYVNQINDDGLFGIQISIDAIDMGNQTLINS